jgi:hypothetical protein
MLARDVQFFQEKEEPMPTDADFSEPWDGPLRALTPILSTRGDQGRASQQKRPLNDRFGSKLRSHGSEMARPLYLQQRTYLMSVATTVIGLRGYRSGAFCAGTIAFPIGHSASPASFTCAQANGMPTMVTASRIAMTR